MAIDYGRFHRLTARAQEIVDAPGASPVVVSVYQHATRIPLSRFAAAHAAVDDAISCLARANLDLSRQLPAVIRHSDTALAAIKAVVPETELPAPLRSQPCDTDKRAMLRRVLKLLDEHRGQDWADALLQGDFGTVAGAFIQGLDDSIHAADALQAARRERAESFEPAWKAFLAYKRLVRSSFGASSRQYRRLLIRTLDAGDQDEAPAQPPAPLLRPPPLPPLSPLPPPPQQQQPLPSPQRQRETVAESGRGTVVQHEGQGQPPPDRAIVIQEEHQGPDTEQLGVGLDLVGQLVLHGDERLPGEAVGSNLEHEDERQLLLRRATRLRQLASEILGDIAERLPSPHRVQHHQAVAPFRHELRYKLTRRLAQ